MSAPICRIRRDRPRSRAAEQRDELAAFQLTKSHAATPARGIPRQHNALASISQGLAAVRDFDPA